MVSPEVVEGEEGLVVAFAVLYESLHKAEVAAPSRNSNLNKPLLLMAEIMVRPKR